MEKHWSQSVEDVVRQQQRRKDLVVVAETRDELPLPQLNCLGEDDNNRIENSQNTSCLFILLLSK